MSIPTNPAEPDTMREIFLATAIGSDDVRTLQNTLRLVHELAREGAQAKPAEARNRALEFAEYMARRAEQLLEAINAEGALRVRREESDDVADDDMYDAAATVGEHVRGLRSGIYEFRKRAASPQPAEVPALTAHAHETAMDAWWAYNGRAQAVGLTPSLQDFLSGWEAALAPQLALKEGGEE